MFIAHVLPLSFLNSEFIPSVASKFTRFESSWLQRVGTIATEGVQNTHNWSGRTETATENGVGQAG